MPIIFLSFTVSVLVFFGHKSSKPGSVLLTGVWNEYFANEAVSSVKLMITCIQKLLSYNRTVQ